MSGETSSSDGTLATWAVASSLLLCFPACGGLVGLILGAAALRSAKGKARTLALVAVLLGAVHLVGVGILWTLYLESRWRDGLVTSTVAAGPPPAPTPSALAGPLGPMVRAEPRGAPGEATYDDGAWCTRVGSVDLVDPSPSSDLLEELRAQSDMAHESGQRVLVVLVSDDCSPCNGFALALGDPRMLQALRSVRVVRINIHDFERELDKLGFPTHAVPGFALLRPTLEPEDYIDGGEWGEDVAANIAPVLGPFVRGEYSRRRYLWRGTVRDDETPL